MNDQFEQTPGWLWAEANADLRLELAPGVPLHFQCIKACPPETARGFLMGSRGEYSDEEPRHRVFLTKEFWLGVFPVAQAQYRLLATWASVKLAAIDDNKGSEPSYAKGNDGNPVEQVSWDDAKAVAEAMSDWLKIEWDRASADSTLRRLFPKRAPTASLPTEAQWEYACRAGTETEYYTGDGEEALKLAGWYEENAGGTTHPVGELARNEFGLYDMHGNVWEWCVDGWDDAAYAKRSASEKDPFTDPTNNSQRVFRGGSFDVAAWGCRSAFRLRIHPGIRYWVRGFRLCLSSGPVGQTSRGAETSQASGAGTGVGGGGTTTETEGPSAADWTHGSTLPKIPTA